jgi:ribosomal protein S18 acetylase RimI-like enzyme
MPNIIIKQLNNTQISDNKDLAKIISLSVGNPTPEKLDNVIQEYIKDTNKHIVTALISNNIVGVIGFTIKNHDCILNHIAVDQNYRNNKVATSLVEYLYNNYTLQSILAETDEEAVAFYQKLGFKCEEFKGKYGKRYKCIYLI